MPSNALAGETSPYLLQHAGNPVQWYPWGPEALERARREGRPILLSVGYSACHWCHVMAHESFEDPETAQLMNRLFVNVKVDREERPDLDRIYQTAHQLLAQRPGGWPLTMFLTPEDQTPFFGGTYFPPAPRFGMPAFRDILARVHTLYQERPDDIRAQNASLREALASTEERAAPHAPAIDPAPLDAGRAQLQQGFDARDGGFGEAPKFPHPTSLQRLLRHYAATANAGKADLQALHIVAYTLEKMASGGIYDQIGGGFCRYSVDERWMIPHFEKMLYDNGLLLALLAETWRVTGSPLLRHAAEATAGWVMREMQSPEGGYYSSLDADSEGEEGRYYVWDREAVREVLGEQAYELVAARYGLDRPPNFEGRWHLHLAQDLDALAARLDRPRDTLASEIDRAGARLLAARERRVPPGRDDKVLTSWNALMIQGMATAGRLLQRPDWVGSAERALDFIREQLWIDDRLQATYKDGRAHLNAYLDDHAYLIEAILALLEARWRDGDLELAIKLAEALLERFEDPGHGGFFFTSHDHEALIHRPKPYGDDATPAGNGVAARALGRLGHLLGLPRYLEAAERALEAAWPSVQRLPYAHDSLLQAAEEYLYPPEVIVIRGEPEALAEWRAMTDGVYAPRRLTLAIPSSAAALPAGLAEREAGPAPRAYVCQGLRCGLPITDVEAFRRVAEGGHSK